MATFLSNLILGIALALPLGPLTLETLNRGLRGGLRKALWVVAGTMLAELIYFSLVWFGISKVAETFVVQNVLGFVGVIFLLYLGIGNVKDFFDKELKEIEDPKRHPFVAGFLITFLYPLNVFMWAGIIAVAMNASPSFVVTSGILWGVLIAYLIVACLGSFGKKFMTQKRTKYVSLIAGLFLIFYGIKMFWSIFIA